MSELLFFPAMAALALAVYGYGRAFNKPRR